MLLQFNSPNLWRNRSFLIGFFLHTHFAAIIADTSDVTCDNGWVSLQDYQPLKTKGRDHFTCLWFADAPGDWYEAHKICGTQFARLVEPQNNFELEALRQYISSNNGSVEMGIWSGFKRRLLVNEDWGTQQMRDLALDPSYFKDIYKQSEVMPGKAWRDEQPNDTKKNGLETCVFRKKLKQPKAKQEDPENPFAFDDFPCSVIGHIVCERAAPDKNEVDQPF